MKSASKLFMYFIISFLVIVFYSCARFGSEGKLIMSEGNLSFLKNEKVVKVKYEYDGMTVGKMTENEYIQKKTSELNKKNSGEGFEWLKNWKNYRTSLYQPQFEENVNKSLNGKLVVRSDTVDVKYTMTLKTVFTEPGYANPFASNGASINVLIIFTETKNPEKILASFKIDKITSSSFGGATDDLGARIAESYVKCGKRLGSLLEEEL
jgi:hypothetical protein